MLDVLSHEALEKVDDHRDAFQAARPFRHLRLAPFLNSRFLDQILAAFPEPNEEAMVNEFGYRSRKHTVEGIRSLGAVFQRWDEVLKSREFLDYLEHVTGIPDLIHDPAYLGAGTHNNLHGQSLDLHVDFNRHPLTKHHRRLNLIVYLCPEWEADWGGSIELHRDAWDRSNEREFVSYLPLANNAILFETSEHSWHGFAPIDLPVSKRQLSRKSLTVYYYTKKLETGKAAETHSTIYVPQWIPESVKPGELLTEQAYAELETMLYRRDRFLQGLYRNQQRTINRYQWVIRPLGRIKRFLSPAIRLCKSLVPAQHRR